MKSTSVKNNNRFNLSRNQFKLAQEIHENYIIAHVHVDLDEKDKNKKYMLTEYFNPVVSEKEVDLCMISKNFCESGILISYNLINLVQYGDFRNSF